MPNNEGKLSKEEKDKIIKWFEKWEKNIVCPICQNQKWQVGDHIVAPPLFGAGLILGGTTYPKIMILCGVCSYTMFFNAVLMGIVPSLEKPENGE